MARITYSALLAVTMLIAAAVPAAAKGAASASLRGPGLDEPIDLLVHEPDLPAIAGAWFTASAEDVRPLAAEPPTDDLGPRYTLTWVMLGPPDLPPEERSVTQHVYPQAEGGALVATPPGQDVWEGAVGWYRAPTEFGELLRSVGVLPSRDAPDPLLPDESGVVWSNVLLLLVGALLGAAVCWRIWRLLRRQSHGAPAPVDSDPSARARFESEAFGRQGGIG